MSRWFLLLGVVWLIACSSGARDPNALVVWESYNNAEHKVFLSLVEQYRAQTPTAPPIVVQRVPFAGLLSKLITAAIANRTPDICRVDVGHIGRLAYGGIAQPLDGFGAREDLADLLPIAQQANQVSVPDLQTGQHQTGLYGVSDQLTCVALYYNKDIFAARGITQPPQTLGELLDVGRRLTQPEQGVYGLGLNNSLWWHLPWLYLHGADVMSDDNKSCRLGESAAEATFTFLRELYTARIEAGAWKAGAINPDQGFINGKYGMVVSGPWSLVPYRAVNYGVALLPGAEPGVSATNIGGTSMIILKNSPRKKAAYDLLKFLTGVEAQTQWAEKTGQLSVNQRANEALAGRLTPAMAVFLEQLAHARPRPRLPNYDQLESLLNPFFYSILDGKVSVGEGLRRAQVAVEREIIPELE